MILRDLEQKIAKDINESNLSIDLIFYLMRSIMQDIEKQYFEFCKMEDMQKDIESNYKNDISNDKEKEEEGAN